eukprot:s1054_g6.t1
MRDMPQVPTQQLQTPLRIQDMPESQSFNRDRQQEQPRVYIRPPFGRARRFHQDKDPDGRALLAWVGCGGLFFAFVGFSTIWAAKDLQCPPGRTPYSWKKAMGGASAPSAPASKKAVETKVQAKQIQRAENAAKAKPAKDRLSTICENKVYFHGCVNRAVGQSPLRSIGVLCQNQTTQGLDLSRTLMKSSSKMSVQSSHVGSVSATKVQAPAAHRARPRAPGVTSSRPAWRQGYSARFDFEPMQCACAHCGADGETDLKCTVTDELAGVAHKDALPEAHRSEAWGIEIIAW